MVGKSSDCDVPSSIVICTRCGRLTMWILNPFPRLEISVNVMVSGRPRPFPRSSCGPVITSNASPVSAALEALLRTQISDSKEKIASPENGMFPAQACHTTDRHISN